MTETYYLKQPITISQIDGPQIQIKTATEAFRFLTETMGDVPSVKRTLRMLQEAQDRGSLRALRAATRAFAEACTTLPAPYRLVQIGHRPVAADDPETTATA